VLKNGRAVSYIFYGQFPSEQKLHFLFGETNSAIQVRFGFKMSMVFKPLLFLEICSNKVSNIKSNITIKKTTLLTYVLWAGI